MSNRKTTGIFLNMRKLKQYKQYTSKLSMDVRGGLKVYIQYICVCVYIYIRVFVYIYIYTNTHACIYFECILNVCVYNVYIYIYIYIHTHTHISAYPEVIKTVFRGKFIVVNASIRN